MEETLESQDSQRVGKTWVDILMMGVMVTREEKGGVASQTEARMAGKPANGRAGMSELFTVSVILGDNLHLTSIYRRVS